MIPYTVQREKIVQAYLKCEIDPWRDCGCFIGNLLNNKSQWAWARKIEGSGRVVGSAPHCPNGSGYYESGVNTILLESDGLYDIYDICKMETNFLSFFDSLNDGFSEDALFHAMVSTLEVLRQIHLAKGDVTAIETPLQKRTLQTA